MSTLQKVEGYSNLRKDSYSGGIVNIDKNSYTNHQNAKRMALQQLYEKQEMKTEVAGMKEEINNIKEQVSDIKQLLMQLINKGQ